MKIETKRLILRELADRDIDDLVEGLNDLRVSRGVSFAPFPYTKKNALEWVKICQKLSKIKNRNSYNFAIELKSEEKVIGSISLDNINNFQGKSTGGFWINSKYLGRGYEAEALSARICFAFDKLKLRRIESNIFGTDSPLIKIQKKLGYKIEGMKRKSFRSMADGKIRDEIMMGILKEDWVKFKRRLK